jgi:hypothetical protein
MLLSGNGEMQAEPLAEVSSNGTGPVSGSSISKLDQISSFILTDDMVGIDEEAVLTSCGAHRPREHDFFRVRPGGEWRATVLLVDYRGDDPALSRRPYLIHPPLAAKFGGVARAHMIYTCVTTTGTMFLWPIKIVEGFGDSWYKSAIRIAELAQTSWMRLISSKGGSGYLATRSTRDHGDPKWRGESLQELLLLAFGDHLVDALDHPLCQVLEIA